MALAKDVAPLCVAGVVGAVFGALLAVQLMTRRFKKGKDDEDDDDPFISFDRTHSSGLTVSSRGMRLNMPELTFSGGSIDHRDPYQVDTLEGDDYILLAIAENKLMWSDMLKPRIKKAFQVISDTTTCYNPVHGTPAFRRALGKFLERCVTKVPVPPEELVCGTGVSAILSNLFYCLCEDGDLVLIPAPYYSAFDSDLRAFSNLRRVLVPLNASNDYELTVAALEATYTRALEATGRAPKALLLTNPHNPLGRIATRDELAAVHGWCIGKAMHLVSDEIYALSVFGSSPSMAKAAGRPVGDTSFTSMAEVCKGKLNDHVHIIYGLSKDLGMSGCRVGMVWSQNIPLLEALGNAAVFCTISGPIQSMVTDLVTDDAFIDTYLQENSRRLAASCAFVLQELDKLNLKYVKPAAGLFIWVDLRPLLNRLTVAGCSDDDLEYELYERLKNDVHIILSQGASQGAIEPGWFRLCYARVPMDTLQKAMAKFTAWVKQSSLGPSNFKMGAL